MGRSSLIVIIIMAFYFSFQTIFCDAWKQPEDKLSLLEFKARIEGDLLPSWNDSVQFCSWPGVTCSRQHRHRVTRLELQSRRLRRQLSPHIGNLSFLRALDLAHNSFSGEIPPEIGRLLRLEKLFLRNNSFSGEIPTNISRCSRLWGVSLAVNGITGEIPEEIGSLSELRQLDLGVNRLVGEIPASIGNLSLLEGLALRNNLLQGAIPASIGRIRRLRVLSLGVNSFKGTIPDSLYNISTIEYFVVLQNKLEGHLPSNLGHTLPNLQYFLLLENHFSGMIPDSMSNASNLIHFEIASNRFTGKVPSLSRSSSLESLVLAENNLGYAESGDLSFLGDIVNCTKLEILSIEGNNFGGEIPETISNMSQTRLEYLSFRQNRISGEIPAGIGDLIGLKQLILIDNRFTGLIPSTLGKLRKLQIFYLDGNSLSGKIPHTLGNLTLLNALRLSRNMLQGTIPQGLGSLRNLKELTLAENNLTGNIPEEVLSLSSLSIYLDLSRNRLSGSIPTEVGRLTNLGYLDVSYNKLSGSIPKPLGSCRSMEYLYLQGNFLQGSVPVELDSLRGLRVMDLSSNNLSGQIPPYLADFRGLTYLNLSSNCFEGSVPLHGVFQNSSQFFVTGNERLCGGWPGLKLPKCRPSSVHNPSRGLKMTIVVSCDTVGLIATSLLVKLAFFSNRRRKSNPEPPFEISLPRVSYGDLSKATDGFSSANLIGAGSFGSVYKGILNQDNTLVIVAVKVLDLRVAHALKSFAVGCESLGNVRHRNLVKLVTVCSSIDFQGRDFKALVYEFMENGNLDDWLHSPRSLNLVQRVSIAIDVASALDYLHNHCSEPIAHCDIKPSNVLLDEAMVACVGDFGLAKLIRSENSSIPTSSAGRKLDEITE